MTFWPIWKARAAGLDRAAFAGNEVDTNHRSPAFLQRETERDRRQRRHLGSRYAKLVAVERHLPEWIEGLDLRFEALAKRVG